MPSRRLAPITAFLGTAAVAAFSVITGKPIHNPKSQRAKPRAGHNYPKQHLLLRASRLCFAKTGYIAVTQKQKAKSPTLWVGLSA